jgi:hypothetical protein
MGSKAYVCEASKACTSASVGTDGMAPSLVQLEAAAAFAKRSVSGTGHF